MRLHSSLLALFLATHTALATAIGAADAPEVQYGVDEVTLRGVPPGAKLFWIGMVRDWHKDQSRVRFVRGSGPATPALRLMSGMDPKRSRWLVVSPHLRLTIRSTAPGYSTSADTIVARAVAGEDRMTIHSSWIQGTYISGPAAWAFSAADGADIDADGQINGTIVLLLTTLKNYRGNPHPPAAIAAGDGILLADQTLGRMAFIEVR